MRGAVGVAERLRISALVTGLVLVGFGTSTPELVTSVNAVLKDVPAIAVGNAVGSNIANILLILGVAALIMPLPAARQSLKRDGPMMALAAVACLFVTQFYAFGTVTGVVFTVALVAYIARTYAVERRQFDAQAALHVAEAAMADPKGRALPASLVLAVAGIVLVIFGADLMVDGSVVVARALGVSDLVIGLTIVAIGTSLPELAASVTAALKREADIAVGNIVGSNIFNMLGILGITALIRPFDVPAHVVRYDVWIMLGVTALLLAIAWRRGRVERGAAIAFLVLYAAYVGFLAVR